MVSCIFKPLIYKFFPYCPAPNFSTLDGENELDHLASSINLIIDVLSILQLIEHLDCCLSLFKLFRYTAQQPASSRDRSTKDIHFALQISSKIFSKTIKGKGV